MMGLFRRAGLGRFTVLIRFGVGDHDGVALGRNGGNNPFTASIRSSPRYSSGTRFMAATLFSSHSISPFAMRCASAASSA